MSARASLRIRKNLKHSCDRYSGRALHDLSKGCGNHQSLKPKLFHIKVHDRRYSQFPISLNVAAESQSAADVHQNLLHGIKASERKDFRCMGFHPGVAYGDGEAGEVTEEPYMHTLNACQLEQVYAYDRI